VKALAVVAVLLAVFLGWKKWVDMQRTKTLNAIASEIAGRSVTVHCPNFFADLIDIHGESGSVGFDENGRASNHTDLRKPVCDALKHFRDRDLSCVTRNDCGEGEERTIDAVLTLAHESYHLAGEANEAVTQCYAVQTIAFTARRLGATPQRADEIAAYYLEHIQPLMPTEYQLPGSCGDGGRLDRHPHEAGWPNPPGD
jgi:hypothetical protein